MKTSVPPTPAVLIVYLFIACMPYLCLCGDWMVSACEDLCATNPCRSNHFSRKYSYALIVTVYVNFLEFDKFDFSMHINKFTLNGSALMDNVRFLFRHESFNQLILTALLGGGILLGLIYLICCVGCWDGQQVKTSVSFPNIDALIEDGFVPCRWVAGRRKRDGRLRPRNIAAREGKAYDIISNTIQGYIFIICILYPEGAAANMIYTHQLTGDITSEYCVAQVQQIPTSTYVGNIGLGAGMIMVWMHVFFHRYMIFLLHATHILSRAHIHTCMHIVLNCGTLICLKLMLSALRRLRPQILAMRNGNRSSHFKM